MNDLNLYQDALLKGINFDTNYYFPPSTAITKLVELGYLQEIEVSDIRVPIYRRIK